METGEILEGEVNERQANAWTIELSYPYSSPLFHRYYICTNRMYARVRKFLFYLLLFFFWENYDFVLYERRKSDIEIKIYPRYFSWNLISPNAPRTCFDPSTSHLAPAVRMHSSSGNVSVRPIGIRRRATRISRMGDRCEIGLARGAGWH